MCGIAGIVTDNPVGLRSRLEAMRDSMAHRGPDDAGVFVEPNGRAGIAACRLAVRDLSPAGHMPMAMDDEHVALTFNGEIYNADELRTHLEARGYRFRSSSDTEVVLRGFEEWGRAVVDRLQGMFAFALLDTRGGEVELLLARDRLGIKPLYYAETSAGLAFASEVQTLRRSGMVEGGVDPTAMVMFLLLGSVPAPLSALKGAKMLPPGCTLELSGTGAKLRSYWRPASPAPGKDAAGAALTVEGLLRSSVRRQLVSDVPLGVFLSGGLDSSTIAVLIRHIGVSRLRTCSISFPGTPYDESRIAGAVASAIEAEHYDEPVTAHDVIQELPRIFRAMDQPTVNGINTYFVSRTAKRAGLTVAMSGVGGDELFGGYANTFDQLPRLLRRLRLASLPGGALAGRLAVWTIPPRARGKLRDALSRAPSAGSAYMACRGLFSSTEVGRLVGPERLEAALAQFDPVAAVEEATKTADPPEDDLFAWTSRAELAMYAGNQLLRDTDVMSMSHSLEVRVPLLDDALVEGVLALPSSAKRGGGVKPLLTQAIGDLLPREVLERSTKQGFTFPFDPWLRGELSETVDTTLNGSALKHIGWLDAAAVEGLRGGFHAGRVHWSRIWALVVLQGWSEAVGRSAP